MKYVAKVKYYGNHYFAGEEVIGTKIEERQGNTTWLFDDEPIEEFPFYGEARNEWVEIDATTLKEMRNNFKGDAVRYIRTKDGITTSNIATHELIEDICCAGYLRTLEKGANVTIGKEWSNFYGRWIDIIDEKGIHYSIEPNEVKNVTKELPQSDNLEELCDRFVLNGIDIIYLNKEHTQYRFENFEEWFDITDVELRTGIYAAIWTDKGLIYVAKMNDKGELKLI